VLALGDLPVHGRHVAAAPSPRWLTACPALHLVAHGGRLNRSFPLSLLLAPLLWWISGFGVDGWM
jgi:hypothetical protein